MKKVLLIILLSTFSQLVLMSQVAVTSSTGTNTSASYGTLDSAITAINGGVKHTGTITVNVSAGHTETIAQRITLTATGTLTNPITIKKSGAGNNPLITAYTGGTATTASANQDGIFALRGSDYVTIDGIDLIENSGNSGNALMEYGYGLFKFSAADGANNNVIKNCTVSLSNDNFAAGTYPAGIGSTGVGVFASLDTTITTILLGSSVSGANGNNKIYSNTLKNCHQGIFVAGANEVSPYTFADRNNDVGGNASTTGNTVLNFGGGTGSNTLSSGIRSAYQYDFNVSYNTINNNDGGGVNHTNTLRGILVAVANEANATINNNTITVKAGITTAQTAAIESGSGTLGIGNKTSISNNVIKNCELGTTSGGFLGVFSAGGPAKLEIKNNTLVNTKYTAATGTFYGFYNQGGVTDSMQIIGNTMDSLEFTVNNSSIVYGNFNNNGAGATSVALNLNMDNNTVKNIVYSGATGGTGSFFAVYNADTALKTSLSNNAIENLRLNLSGGFYFVYNIAGSVANGTRIYDNNSVVGSFRRTKSGGLFYGIFESGTQLGTNKCTMSNNNISNINIDTTGSTVFYGIYTSGGSAPFASKKIFGNTIASVVNGASTCYAMFVNSYGGADTTEVYNNKVEKIRTRSTLAGIFVSTVAENAKVYNNTVDSITTVGTAYGIYCGGGSTNSTVNYYRNRVSRVYGYSTAIIYGMFCVTGQNINIYNNMISDLKSPSSSSATGVTGIFQSSALNLNIYNNTIEIGKSGQVTSTAATFGVSGFYYNATTTNIVRLYNNIIWVDAVPTTTAMVSAVRRASGTANVVPVNFFANNNIYRVNSGANNWIYVEGTVNTTNNNGFASATVTPVTARNLMVDANFNTPCGEYKKFMTSIGEINTTTEDNLTSLGNNAWRPSNSIASTAESGALVYPLTGNKDYLGNNRNTTKPDIGAVEFAGIINDLLPPVIAFTPIGNTYYCPTAPTLVTTIDDVTGVNNFAGTKPRLYYKKSTEKDTFGTYPGDNVSAFNGWKFVESTGSTPNFNFVPDYTLLGSTLAVSQTLQYFVIAQDIASTPNVGSNSVGYKSGYCPTTVVLAAGAGPTRATPIISTYKRDTFISNSVALVSKNAVCFADSIMLKQLPVITNANYQWQLDTNGTYADVTGANGLEFTSFVNKFTRFRMKYSCGATLLGYSLPDSTISLKPNIVNVSNDTICGSGNAKLKSTTSNGSFTAWYNSPSALIQLDTGAIFTTPLINTTTDYYAAASNYLDASGSIGNGTGTNAGTGTSPFTTSQEGARSQFLYKSADLIANGFVAGIMKSLSFELTSATSFYLKDYTIKVGHTNLTALSTVTDIPNTTVYGPDSLPITPIGWKKFNFSTPFFWDGVSNIIVEVCHQNDPLNGGLNLYAGTTSVRVTTTNFTSVAGRYQHNSFMCGLLSGTSTTTALRPNIRFDFANLCESSRQMVRAFVKPAPLANFTLSDSIICQGDKVTLTGTSINPAYKFGWLPSNDTGAVVSYKPNLNTTYTMIAIDSSNSVNKGCKQQISKNLVVKPNVPQIVVSKTKDSICNRGDTLRLTSSVVSLLNQEVVKEDFESGAPNWTAINESSGGTPALAAWTIFPSGTSVAGSIHTSNNNSKFISSNSDAQGSGGITKTKLISKSIDMSLYTNPKLSWFHYFNYFSSDDTAIVEASTDSITWTKVKSYQSAQGTASNFSKDSVNMNAYAGMNKVYLRFRYESKWGFSWALDNVLLSGDLKLAPIWSPISGLFKNLATNTAYASTQDSVIYAKPLVSTNYVATVTNTNGCFRTDTAKIYVAQPVTIVTKPAAAEVCKGSKYVMNVKALNGKGYQWIFNGIDIVGATDSTYTINNATVSDSGNYSIRIKGTMPCNDSTLPTVLINVKGSQVNITAQPMTTSVCQNQLSTPISLSVTALNASGYQWTKNGGNISGANAATFSIANPALSDSGNYAVKVLGIAPCGDSTSTTVKVNVIPKVSISAQPVDTSLCNTGNISFSVTASNVIGYQWRKNGSNISGATASSYSKTGATISDTGNYDVVITGLNPCSNLISNVAKLNVALPILISKQPRDTAVCVSSGQTFKVTATNVFKYQWKLNNSIIVGAINSTYTLPNVSSSDTGKYMVLLTAYAPCPVVSSDTVKLKTVGAVIINAQPSNQILCENNSATFSISASNAGGYQWRKNGVNITGATNSSYTITSLVLADSGNYDVVLSDTSSCGSIFSAAAKLTVNAVPTISIQPTNQVLCANDVLTLSVTGQNALSYQWRKAGTNIIGATSTTYTINPVLVSDAGLYDVVLKGKTACADKTSNSISVSISPKPAVTVQPVAQTVCANGSATFSVTANNAISYQWRRNGVNILGATTATYSVASATTALAGSIDVVITGNSPCASVTSSAVAFVVNTTATISTHPATQSLCEGSSLSLSVVTSNATAYQWRKNGVNITGASSSSYVVASTASTHSGNYDVVVSSAAPCLALTSNVAVVTINKAIQVTTKPLAQTLCVGNSMTLSISANNQAGYQWYQGNSQLVGATSSTYTVSSVTGSNSGTYKVYITALAPCSDSFTVPVSVTINNPMVVITHPTSQTVCEGTNVTFTSAVSFATGYQWRKNGVNIAGATNGNYTITAAGLTNAASYDVFATTSAPCPSITTNSASLSVNKPIAITAQPVATTVCVGSPISFGVTANNATAYQWQKVNINIPGATNATFTIPSASVSDAAGYSVVVTGISPCPIVISSTVNATVRLPVTGAVHPISQTVCKGNNLTLSTGANNELGVQWRKNGANISGATTYNYSINNIDVNNAGNYDVVFSATNPCPNVISNAASIAVSVPATIISQPVGLTQCEGNSVNISVSANGATSYQWRRNGVNVSGANSATLVMSNVTLAQAGYYDVVINGTAPCVPVTSSIAQVIVNAAAAIITHPIPQTLCVGQALTLSIIANNAVNYQWKKDGVDISGANSITYVIPVTTVANAGVYSVIANANLACNNLISNTANVVINKRAVINAFPMDATICEGSTLSMSVYASDAAGYEWFKNGISLLGAINNTIVIDNANTSATGDYSVKLTSALGCPSVTTPAAIAVVNAAPSITTQPLSQTVCSANTLILNIAAINNAGYQWRKDGVDIAGATLANLNLSNVNATSQGVYDVKVSGLTSCAVKISAAAFVAIKTAPSIISQSGAIVYAKQQKSVTLFVSASAAVSYQWRKDGVNIAGANTSTLNIGWVVAADYADYDVVIGGEAPCATTTSAIIKLAQDNNTTDINALTKNLGFKIENLYPNPTTGNAKLIISTSKEMEGQIDIYNAVGQLISSELVTLQSGSQEHAISTATLSAGKYMVKVTVNGRSEIGYLVYLGSQ